MIKIIDLSIRFNDHIVFDHFSYDVPLTGNTVLRGASGSGKTTLIRILAGLLKPNSGSVSGLEDLQPAIVFQEDRLLPWHSTLKNVALVSNSKKAELVLTHLGLGDFLHVKPAALSGGMNRRVAIARALALGGDIFLLDEPFSGLDENAKRLTADVLHATGVPLIAIVHSDSEAVLINPQTILQV